MSLTKDLTIRTCEMHTGGAPARLIIGGFPELGGNSLTEKRLCAISNYNHIRKFCMLEPRGNSNMNGAILVKPCHPEAHVGAIFIHVELWGTMCGHVTMAIARYALDHGWIPDNQRKEPETQVNIEAPCGLVRTFVEYNGKRAGRVRFHSVPAFAFALDVEIDVPQLGKLNVDIGYGGAFYGILSASSLGLDMHKSGAEDFITAGSAVREAVSQQVKLYHPHNPDPESLCGVMITDGKDVDSSEPMANVVVLPGQVDRSPCGSGTTARIAVQFAKGHIGLGQERISQSGITGSCFTAKVHAQTTCGDIPAVVVAVSGKAHYIGSSVFTLEEDDDQKGGFTIR